MAIETYGDITQSGVEHNILSVISVLIVNSELTIRTCIWQSYVIIQASLLQQSIKTVNSLFDID